jgi:ankyrin
MRITCKLQRLEKLENPPPLAEDEALASRVLKMGPVGATFNGSVVIEVPHFASLRDGERDIIVLRSDNGTTWRRHSALITGLAVHDVLGSSFEGEGLESAETLYHRRVTRIVASDFPMYFAIVTQVHRDTSVVPVSGGVLNSTVESQVEAVIPAGAFKKDVRLSLQVQPVPHDMATKILRNQATVSPIVTLEPQRRKFHSPVTLTIPVPPSLKTTGTPEEQMDDTDISNLRLLCSLTEGSMPSVWQDITGQTPLTLADNCVSLAQRYLGGIGWSTVVRTSVLNQRSV